MFEINNGIVFDIKTTRNGGLVTEAINPETYVSMSETETKKIYQWTQFNLEQGKYVDDTTNADTITIDGVEYTPIDGKVEIDIEPA